MASKKLNPIEAALAAPDKSALKNRTVQYLSPSSVLCMEKTPVEFFFRYLSPVKPAFEQTRPMAYGSAFDMRVKELLALRDQKRFKVANYGLLKAVDKAYHRDIEMKRMCNLLAQEYVEGPAGAHLKKFKPVIMEGTPAIVSIGKVPIYGKVDVQTDEPRILDFKVSGSCSQAYPVVGYVDSWHFDPKTGDWEQMGEHKGGFKSIIDTHEDWAFQLTTYDMIRTKGACLNRKSPIGIDQVSFHPNGKIAFTHLREEIPTSFKKDVVARYQKAWRRIARGEVIPVELRGMPVDQLDLLRGQIRKW